MLDAREAQLGIDFFVQSSFTINKRKEPFKLQSLSYHGVGLK